MYVKLLSKVTVYGNAFSDIAARDELKCSKLQQNLFIMTTLGGLRDWSSTTGVYSTYGIGSTS